MGFPALYPIHMDVVVRNKCICSMADSCMTSSSYPILEKPVVTFIYKNIVHGMQMYVLMRG
jgi:hypothetical protein